MGSCPRCTSDNKLVDSNALTGANFLKTDVFEPEHWVNQARPTTMKKGYPTWSILLL